VLRVRSVARSVRFFRALGLRRIMERDELAILELRGGTHLLLFPTTREIREKRIRHFDLMVDDVPRCHRAFGKRKLRMTEVREERMGGHLWFEVIDPAGRALGVYSPHTEGRAV
jgi:catechol 2,3-dioxygenase-like lactoylglutathione lyase family enzyme